MHQPPLLLWMVAVPIIGACLVLLVANLGIVQVRRMALTNVLLTLVLAVVMVKTYDPQLTVDGKPRLLQMTSSIPWLSTQVDVKHAAAETAAALNAHTLDSEQAAVGPNIRMTLGVDGISLWLIALAAVMIVPAVHVSWGAI